MSTMSNDVAHKHHHHHQHSEDHHVHFDQTVIKDDFETDNAVGYTKAGHQVTVHLGFLQIHHRYSIELNIPQAVFSQEEADNSGQPIVLVADEKKVPNIHCKMIEFSDLHQKEGEKTPHYSMKLEFFAHKEKLLKEELYFHDANNSHIKVKIVFAARVLGRGKGTPMLRNGIHCTGIELEDESEASDWTGFSRTDTNID